MVALKRQLLFLLLLAVSAGCTSARKEASPSSVTVSPYSCSCDKIGLNVSWADSNQVTCYLIPVPRNAKDPAAGTYQLAAAVAAADSKTPLEPLLYLHGGPGIATLENLPKYLKSSLWKHERSQRDLIFFDYRGTGHSEPQLCAGIEDSLWKFSSKNPSAEAKAAYEVQLYKTCLKELQAQGTRLSTFTTYQLAADAEAIRQALRIPAWNIYGVSYGTTVALHALRHFQKNLKSVVLDSPYPPNAPWSDFVRPFESCFRVLENKLAADPATARTFSSLRTDFVSAVNRLNKNPVRMPRPGTPETDTANFGYYTGAHFSWSISSALLKPKAIGYVPLAIHEVANGNEAVLRKWAGLFSQPNAHGKFSEPQNHAILCYEDRPRSAEARDEYLLEKYPDFSAFMMGYPTALCQVWRPDTANAANYQPVSSQIPVLILCGEYDPVCPPLFGQITAKTLPNATLVVVPDASHAAAHADDCTRNMVHGFFLQPTQPVNTACLTSRPKTQFLTNNLLEALENYKGTR